MNPYHEPMTAAAILTVAKLPRLDRRHSLQLRQLLEDMDGPGSLPAPASDRRAIEIVLSRVRMHEPMRRDLMLRLRETISAEMASGRFSPLKWIRADLSAWGESASTFGITYVMTWTYRDDPEVWFEVHRYPSPALIYQGGDEEEAKAAAQADCDQIRFKCHAAQKDKIV